MGKFSVKVITSSLFDNENVIIGVIVKVNEVRGGLVAINVSDNYSEDLNVRISKMKDIFKKNVKIKDSIEVLKTSTLKYAMFDKILVLNVKDLSSDRMIAYIKEEIFKSIIDIEVIEKAPEAPVLEAPPVDAPPIEAPVEEEVKEEETVTEDSKDDDLIDSIVDDSLEGDKDLEEDEDFDDLKELDE